MTCASFCLFFVKINNLFAYIRNIVYLCSRKIEFLMKNVTLFLSPKSVFLCVMLCSSLFAFAQVDRLLGNWKTVDDKTGEVRSVVTIYKGADGLYYGKISKMLMYTELDLKCEACKDEDHNAPFEGLVIIRGMKYDRDANQLVSGRVLDPESGKFYYGKIYTKDGKLILRGSLDKRGILGRNQTWLRAEN